MSDVPDDELARALRYARTVTALGPVTEGRLRGALTRRGHDEVAVDEVLACCRQERLVDDLAYATAFVAERRAKGHAGPRIRQDLTTRGFDAATIDVTLGSSPREDPEAAAFDVATTRAKSLRGLDTEVAYRRLVGYLARRGHAEGLARKVARQALFTDREPQRQAER